MEIAASGISAASGLLRKPRTYQKSLGSWDLRYLLPKIEKSAEKAHFFGSGQILCKKNPTSNVRGSISGVNQIFTGEIPQ